MEKWPRTGNGRHAPVLMCFKLENVENITITSSGKGTFFGNGAAWWGIPGVGYLVHTENRPKLFVISHAKNILLENMLFKNSPYWTVDVTVDGMEIRNCDVSNRRTQKDGHSIFDLTAFNTDGFDVRGNNIWIHDCNIWNQDDCIAVKGQSSNMVFERINASGLGLTIGSMGDKEYAKNITFRDSYMHKTWKGIYIKFREMDSGGSIIENILYENIIIDQPEQAAIWIGPAQQSDTRELCAPHPCSICWPDDPYAKCNAPVRGSFRNITLKNIVINHPKNGALLFANNTNKMENVVFDGVIVNGPTNKPFKDYYYCEGVENGIARGGTNPVPSCFTE